MRMGKEKAPALKIDAASGMSPCSVLITVVAVLQVNGRGRLKA